MVRSGPRRLEVFSSEGLNLTSAHIRHHLREGQGSDLQTKKAAAEFESNGFGKKIMTAEALDEQCEKYNAVAENYA